MTDLLFQRALNDIPNYSIITLFKHEISSTEDDYTFQFCSTGYASYYQFSSYFVLFQSNSDNFLPLIKDYKSSSEYANVQRVIYDWYNPECDEYDYCTFFRVDQINKMYVEKPVACVAHTTLTQSKADWMFVPEMFEVIEFVKDRVKFRVTKMLLPDNNDRKMVFKNLTSLDLNYPPINQIEKALNNTPPANLPKGIRQVVFSSYAQLSVNSPFRGRQTPHIAPVYLFISRLKQQYGPETVEIIFNSAFNGQQVIAARIDLSTAVENTFIYIKTNDEAPLYSTLRFPSAMLELLSVQTVYKGTAQAFSDTDEFDSNVIVANAGMAAAYIGGGLLSGLGQGLGAYAQGKMQMQMQDRTLSWYEKKQMHDIDNQRYLQQSMFDWKSHMQDREFDYGNEQQKRQIDWQRSSQAALFSQQNLYQNTQNKFTKELVEANLDSDIRRARNAQQLSGYRTDATVSGLTNSGRGGLGHPDAPRGATLPPRSASTQTNSPKVYTTRPTGFYTGPMSSNDNRV
ncbi:hypothetical protein [Escherichia coli]|uniref:hypothetical protein n=1 Tax=Escherichia coli TaxID=562 RepID=UPI003F8BB534